MNCFKKNEEKNIVNETKLFKYNKIKSEILL